MWKYFEISNISNNISPDILFQRVLSNVLFNTCVYFYSLCGWEKVHVEKHVLPSSVSLFFSLFSFSSLLFFFLCIFNGNETEKEESSGPAPAAPPTWCFLFNKKSLSEKKKKHKKTRREKREKRERRPRWTDSGTDDERERKRERERDERRETREKPRTRTRNLL